MRKECLHKSLVTASVSALLLHALPGLACGNDSHRRAKLYGFRRFVSCLSALLPTMFNLISYRINFKLKHHNNPLPLE